MGRQGREIQDVPKSHTKAQVLGVVGERVYVGWTSKETRAPCYAVLERPDTWSFKVEREEQAVTVTHERVEQPTFEVGAQVDLAQERLFQGMAEAERRKRDLERQLKRELELLQSPTFKR